MTTPQAPADQQTVRRHNLSLIAAAVGQAAGSRAELAQRTGLTKATVSSLVDALLAQGILIEGEPPAARVGRPARPVSLNPDGPLAVGLEINVDYLAACVLDLTGRVRAHRQVMVDNRQRTPATIVAQLGGLARAMLAAPDRLLGLALALPGAVGADGRLARAPNLPQLTGEAAGAALAGLLGAPAPLVDNEANFGALGWLRAEPGTGDFVYVSGEIGVGAGLVVNGTLFRGASGFAGELGHVVVQRDGPVCGCGGHGCLEQYAGQDVLLRAAGQHDPSALVAAVAAGEPRALAAVAAAGSALGVGLASLLNVVDLPRVVLGGVYARLFDAITPPLQEELDRRVLSASHPGAAGDPSRRIALVRSGLGAEAAVLGAAGAVVDQALKDPGTLAAPGTLTGSGGR
jgi:predicted NBD/HSP70 family sugar kinase